MLKYYVLSKGAATAVSGNLKLKASNIKVFPDKMAEHVLAEQKVGKDTFHWKLYCQWLKRFVVVSCCFSQTGTWVASQYKDHVLPRQSHHCLIFYNWNQEITILQKTTFPDIKVRGAYMGLIWADRTQAGPMMAPWTLLSGFISKWGPGLTWLKDGLEIQILWKKVCFNFISKSSIDLTQITMAQLLQLTQNCDPRDLLISNKSRISSENLYNELINQS